MMDAVQEEKSHHGYAPKVGIGVGSRALLWLVAGYALVPLIFIGEGFRWLLLGWNVVLVLFFIEEVVRLPRAAKLSIRRTFAHPFEQLRDNEVTVHIHNHSNRALRIRLQDEVADNLTSSPIDLELDVAANCEASAKYAVRPAKRGLEKFNRVFARYESGLRFAQRLAIFEVQQTVRVLPNLRGNDKRNSYLMRSRQILLEHRATILRGQGREFESLKDFQQGDEMRNVCWTATARRGKLVATQRRVERSQIIWTVIDCGRLMRARVGERSKLDYAVESMMALAQVSDYGGDSSAVLAYGRHIQQRRQPGRGVPHLHAMLQQAALVHEEAHEADHLMAVSNLMRMQKSRAMIVWITDLADLAITAEVVTAALMASRRHLVVMAVIGQPDVTRLLEDAPADAEQALLYAAASELTARRELALAQLRARGVRAIEINAPHLTSAVLNQYLEVKQKNLL